MSGAGRRDVDKRNYQPLALAFWSGHAAVFGLLKPIVQRESRHWMHSMKGHLPLRPDLDLLLWRDPITSANGL
jgi:hypothetical protein